MVVKIIDEQILLRCVYDPERDVAQIWLCTAGLYEGSRLEQVRMQNLLSYYRGPHVKEADICNAYSPEKHFSWWSQRTEDPMVIYEKVIKDWPLRYEKAFWKPKPVVVVCKEDGREISQSPVRLMMHYARLYQSVVDSFERNGHGDGASGIFDRDSWTMVRRLEGFIASQVGAWKKTVLV